MNIKQIVFSLLFTTLFAKPCFVEAQNPTESLNPKEIKLLVDSLSNALNRWYIYPDKAALMVNSIKKNYKNGAYNKIKSKPELAMQLHRDIQLVQKDGHLRVDYDAPFAKHLETPMTEAEKKQELEEALSMAHEDNFAFIKTEILPGNIGYVRWDGFMEFVEEAKPTIDAAFKFVSNCKAMIIDMRYNGGGSPDMVLYTQSYFFEQKTRMNDIISGSNDTIKRWAEPTTTSFKLNMPVYILTDKRTFSGAEDFTYGLQQVKRAVVVGDTTGGGAHPTGPCSIGQGFVLTIPTHRSFNIVTKTDWEGTGVRPTVAVPAQQALGKAQVLIFNLLLLKAKDGEEKNMLQWNLNCTENKMKLTKQLETDSIKIAKETLLKYMGDYIPVGNNPHLQPVSIISKGGFLYRRMITGEEVRLVPITGKLFVYNDETGRTLEFVLDNKGEVSAITLLRPDGVYTLTKKK
ncbi:MAG TPA: S41 family peptidase [Bacteroidia bacterium]|jgi:C-terminal processing protease CtpA/Prc|nr:S41 family peptidase [Bacteroidia bacterium]